MISQIFKSLKPKILNCSCPIYRAKKRLSEKGTAAMMVISTIAILSILAAGMSTIIVNEMQMIAQYQNRTRAYYVAQAGIAHALWELNGNGDADGVIDWTSTGGNSGEYRTDYDGGSGVLRAWGRVGPVTNPVERRISVKVNYSSSSTTWTTQGDFENNDVTGQGATTRSQVDTSSSPGDVRLNQGYSLVYTQTSNPSTYNLGSNVIIESPRAITADSSGIYVAGHDYSPGNYQWRIEKRNLTTGALIWTQTSNPSPRGDIAWAITADSTGIYVAGYDSPSIGDMRWRIEKRNLSTGALISGFGTGGVVTSNPTTNWDSPRAITADSSGIYVAGYDYSPGNSQWRIEKRNLSTGALVSGFGTGGVVTSNPSTNSDGASAITADSSGIYVAGYDESLGSSNRQGRIEKRNLTTGALIWTQASKSTYGIAADSTGIYVTGSDNSISFSDTQWRIEKRNLTTGALISGFGTNGVVTSNPSSGGDSAWAITADSSGIHVAGVDYSPGNSQWRIEKRNLTTGALIGAQTSNPSSTGSDIAFAITADSTGIYVAGSDYSPGNYQWRIEKYAFRYNSPGTISGLRIEAPGGTNARWTSISWTGTTPDNTEISFRTRGPTGGWEGPYTTSGSLIDNPASNWLEIELTLESADGANTPTLNDFTLNYESAPYTLDYSTWRSN